MKSATVLIAVLCIINLSINPLLAKTKNQLPYKNSNLTAEARATDLLSRMSINDKVNQLMALWDGVPTKFDLEFLTDTIKMREIFGEGIHSIQPNRFTDINETVETRNKIQKYLLEKTRLGIPAFFFDEGQHGLMKPEATAFPMAIGLASSWNPQLFKEVYAVTAAEMRSRGGHHALSPVIDVCRDPRWGRVDETYGEDPYLNGILGSAAVIGLQGSTTGEIMPENVAATLKHLCGHGQPEGGLNQAPANISERVLREYHFPPFKAVIENANPTAVMPSYNEIDGKPSHANYWLIQDVLRKEWGYNGMVVSDYEAINQLQTKHFVAANTSEAALQAFNTGVQYELPKGLYYKHLPELLNDEKIKITDINKAVYQCLVLKFKMGLFENTYVDASIAIQLSKKPESRKLALKAAHQSIVLLKNENNLLPLQKDNYKRIAVIGPNSNVALTGGYSGEPYQKVTLLEGIKAKVGKKTEVLHAQGCNIVSNLDISQNNWKKDLIQFPSRAENLKLIEEAVEVAKKSEIVILAIGETEQLCREAWSKTHLGDAHSLDLFGEQQELVEAMVATGKPIVVYLMNGRPLTINYIEKNIPAIIEGWYMGQETGTAAADIIFGDVNPSGKLTITFPRSVGQLPMYYNHKPSAQFMDYVSESTTPLYPFGYGLSYTSFTYSNMQISSTTMKPNDTVTMSVDVTNSGKIRGDEIVQMYIRDKVSSVTRPIMELKGFERITLEPNQTITVQFTIDKSKLAFWDYNMKYTVEPGEFDVMVGKSSADLMKLTLRIEE
ncbi:MAG: glycoside hydrolase family 3 C-terminal domain-containing protein [Salinivirgaceae bacterium]|jgi:beta-glucosidase|nr:glycoside hydrolase family 3 C-terminal domain-containing protein [Salinivirgaceae bacterium]